MVSASFATDLLTWFAAHQRDLPWRKQKAGERPPYEVWISEMMLQQTQVASVIPYFERWLKRFPDLASLAQSTLDEVLKLWEGLGYYRRARLVHRCALELFQNHAGVFPQSYSELIKLPGLGPYSAAAVAALAFNEAVIALDGNMKRVASRLFCLGLGQEKSMQAQLLAHLPQEAAGGFNEALIELGALICSAREPKCSLCPMQQHCQAYQTSRVAEFPQVKLKKKVPRLERYALIFIQDNLLWLRQRHPDELLGGLWGFVLTDNPPQGEQLAKVHHAYTHFKLTVYPVIVSEAPEQSIAIDWDNLAELALSRLDHKICDELDNFKKLSRY